MEPVPRNVQLLRANLQKHQNELQGGKTLIEPVAVLPGTKPKRNEMTFYAVSEDIDPETGKHVSGFKFPHWTSRVGSFNEEHVRKHLKNSVQQFNSRLQMNKTINDFIHRISVETISIDMLLQRTGIRSEDIVLLLIDTEGFDCVLISSWDFRLLRPGLIIWEDVHCSSMDRQKAPRAVKPQYLCKRLDRENMLCSRSSHG